MAYGRGQSYALLKWDYHWARPHEDGLCVTLVDMVEKEGSRGAPPAVRKGGPSGPWARLVAPRGLDPVHAFSDEEPSEEQRLQRDALIKAARNQLNVQLWHSGAGNHHFTIPKDTP